MEYLEGYSTTMRCVARKVGLYGPEMVSPWEHYFQTGKLVYDSIPPLGLSLRSPIEFIQSPIGFI